MARLSQRPALGVLFLVLAVCIAGIGIAAASHRVWVVAVAAGAIAAWLGSLSWSLLRPR